ncbi:MAG: molybdenum cofactor guanylyltransferase [Acidobacteriia bacterium]|nr:molybdenum cofactor guanylyltransferase [Terriglobia bacterium]
MRDIAGFVLAGGNSTRMGSDKALLPLAGGTLLEQTCRKVEAAAGCAVIIGPPERYSHLGWEVCPDRQSGLGPLAGIVAALSLDRAEWNLIVACDMPALETPFLRLILSLAAQSGAACLLPAGPDGRAQPLCAVYHAASRQPLADALSRGVRKVRQALESVPVKIWQVDDKQAFLNLNTPADWASLKT